jgi:hypothetical protein
MADKTGKALVKGVIRTLLPEPEPQVLEPQEQLLLDLERAKKELEQARLVFAETTDHELIDLAVYRLKLSEEKYRYLLRQARATRIVAPFKKERSEPIPQA